VGSATPNQLELGLMAKYHDYLQDGFKLDEMYQAEDVQEFDAWYQSDVRPLGYRLLSTVMSAFSFGSILDIGCGKGTQTHLMALRGRRVVAYDISSAAIRKAKASYPDIDFRVGDGLTAAKSGGYDCAVMSHTLVMQENWQEVIREASTRCNWLIVVEYIPADTTWHIPDINTLQTEFEKHCSIDTKIVMNDNRILLVGKSRR
jgi:SAM-dependent methyltransferase